MMIPDALVIAPLGGTLVLGAFTHYRLLGRKDARALSLPFVIGLVAVLAIFGYLLSGTIWPDWAARRPVFLILAVVLLCGVVGVMVYDRKAAAD